MCKPGGGGGPFTVSDCEGPDKGTKAARFQYSFLRSGCLLYTYAESRFDLIILSNTLRIMPYPENMLAEVMRILKPDISLIAPAYVHAECRKARIISPPASAARLRAYQKGTQQSYWVFRQRTV